MLKSCTLLVGAEAFWLAAQADMASASARLLVQAMTFEADEAGAAVGAAIGRSPARDRRILVDDYTRYVISDRMIRWPARPRDEALLREAADTWAMFDTLRLQSVGVRVTNPIGPLLAGYPFRNHKKLIVADGVAYLGGVNFSDHNFAWRDLMLRIEDEAAADRLAADFDDTWRGRGRAWTEEIGPLRLISLDGRSNARGFSEIIARIDAARSSIEVVSPYLTFPFTRALSRASERGVSVRLVTPLANNKPLVRDYVLPKARRSGWEVALTPEMIHLKALMIDRRELVLGSSNFDFVSYHGEEELVVVISDAALIAQFEAQVLGPLLECALPADAHQPARFAEVRSRLALRAAEAFVRTRFMALRTSRDWAS